MINWTKEMMVELNERDKMGHRHARTDLELAMSHLLGSPQPLPEAKDILKTELPPELAHQHAEGKDPGGHVQLLCTPQHHTQSASPVCTAWDNTAVLVQSRKKKKQKKKKKTTSFGHPIGLIACGRVLATVPRVIQLCKDMLRRRAQSAGIRALCMHAPRCKLRWETTASQNIAPKCKCNVDCCFGT